jgi:hypothetical protein
MYLLVHVTVTNVATESALFTSANQNLIDAHGPNSTPMPVPC